MAEALNSGNVSTRRRRIAELGRAALDKVIVSVSHVIDGEWLKEAFRLTRKDGAPGVDGQTIREFRRDLKGNLGGLLRAFWDGTYQAPPVRRVEIAKGPGKTRPIGIPTLGRKILERAVLMVLEPLYEAIFRDCSWGFRPKRSAYQALKALRAVLSGMAGGWVYEVDIRGFFDSLDHHYLRELLDLRVRDKHLRRMIDKWLAAGISFAGGRMEYPEVGAPQGGVISPLLANVYLHYVLDVWFEDQVRPRLKGKAFLVRFADDFVLVFERHEDAVTMQRVLPKRFGKYGLALHPEKTRLVAFRRPRRAAIANRTAGTFDFLGFTHYWGRSRQGYWVVKRKTMKSRLTRAVREVAQWCRKYRHEAVRDQHRALCQKLRGHYQYYGVIGNWDALKSFLSAVERAWRKWLHRRSQKARMHWSKFKRLLKRYPLPEPRIVHVM